MTHPTIDELVRRHDDEPDFVAGVLRALADDGVPAADLPRYGWLVNHVIGEKEGAWAEAASLIQRVAVDSEDPAVLRHRAVAALLAARPVEAWAIETRLASVTGAAPAEIRVAVQLGVLQFGSAAVPAPEAALALQSVIDEVAAWTGFGPLATPIAAALNNTVSAILEREDADPADAAVRRVLVEGAEAARRAWRAAGTWVNFERADYLVALCRNKIGDWEAARDAAQSGLDTITANGTEDVDRAFLLLELGRAWRGLGDEAQREEARAAAKGIAAGFEAAWLTEWFERMAAA